MKLKDPNKAPVLIDKKDIERFFKYCLKSKKGCWNWIGSKQKSGYGQIKIKNQTILCHRFSFIIHIGEIPPNMCVCHSCDNRHCVNPDHLWIGSIKQNNQDMFKKGRNAKSVLTGNLPGEDTPTSKLKNSDILKIRHLYKNGLRQVDIACRFNIVRQTVSKIVTRRSWSHI